MEEFGYIEEDYCADPVFTDEYYLPTEDYAYEDVYYPEDYAYEDVYYPEDFSEDIYYPDDFSWDIYYPEDYAYQDVYYPDDATGWYYDPAAQVGGVAEGGGDTLWIGGGPHQPAVEGGVPIASLFRGADTLGWLSTFNA